MTKRKHDIEVIISAVAKSKSIAQVLRELQLDISGGNYLSINKFIRKHGIDTSHFTGQLWNKNKKFPPKRPIDDYLSNQVFITSNHLRKRLLKEGIFEHKCAICNNTEWMGEPIPLELDHKNGLHDDNSLSNLRMLCPNCHAQTETYCGKNIGRRKRHDHGGA